MDQSVPRRKIPKTFVCALCEFWQDQCADAEPAVEPGEAQAGLGEPQLSVVDSALRPERSEHSEPSPDATSWAGM